MGAPDPVADTGDEQTTPQARSAATCAAASATYRRHVLDRQVLDRDIAGIDEQAALAAVAVQSLHRGATNAIGAGDGQRRPALQIDRQEVCREINGAGDVDDVVGVLRRIGAADVDRSNIGVKIGLARDREDGTHD